MKTETQSIFKCLANTGRDKVMLSKYMALRSTFIILRSKETTKCLCRTLLTLIAHHSKALALWPLFASCHPLLFIAPYSLAGWLFIKVKADWTFQMWVLERHSPSWQTQLSQFWIRLTLYQNVFLASGDNCRLFTRYNRNVTLNEDKRCAGSVIAVWAFLRTAY